MVIMTCDDSNYSSEAASNDAALPLCNNTKLAPQALPPRALGAKLIAISFLFFAEGRAWDSNNADATQFVRRRWCHSDMQ